MLERTDAITNEVLEPNTFVLAYPTVLVLRLSCVSEKVGVNKEGVNKNGNLVRKKT